MADRPVDVLFDMVERRQVTFPFLLFTRYRTLGLSDQDAMVILQVFAHQQVENTFPSLDDLVSRMALSKGEVAAALQRLFAEGWLVQTEQRVSLRPLLERMIGGRSPSEGAVTLAVRFEEEFGRLLSPLEYEQINRWIQEDHPEWLVIEALRESVLSGVYNFRYVDSILRDWSRAKIGNSAQLDEYRSRHRKRAGAAASGPGSRRPAAERGGDADAARSDRVVPAAQPGKYEVFYKAFQKKSFQDGNPDQPLAKDSNS